MGLWSTHITPRLVECGSTGPEMLDYRRRVCADLTGTVVELGFGSGPNLEAMPAQVSQLLAVEPSDVAWRLSARRRAASPVAVERRGLDGRALDLPDQSADAVLSTLTLCTIDDAAAALREVARVLRPGGALHFLEHGHAPDASVVRWQRRLEPLQARVFDGCRLTRRIDALVEASGLVMTDLDTGYAPVPSADASVGLRLPRARAPGLTRARGRR